MASVAWFSSELRPRRLAARLNCKSERRDPLDADGPTVFGCGGGIPNRVIISPLFAFTLRVPRVIKSERQWHSAWRIFVVVM